MIGFGSSRFFDWTYWAPNPIQIIWGLGLVWVFQKYVIPSIDSFGRERLAYYSLIYPMILTSFFLMVVGGMPLLHSVMDHVWVTYPATYALNHLVSSGFFVLGGIVLAYASILYQIKADKKNLRVMYPLI